jgi:hypothetical protein
MKRTMIAGLCALTLLLAAGHAARAEIVAAELSWSRGESNSGSSATDEQDPRERDDRPTENAGLNKASPKLM